VTHNEHDRLPVGTAKCPIDRSKFTSKSILDFDDWPRMLRNLWGTITVECGHPCDFVGSPEQFTSHCSSMHCPKRNIACPAEECGFICPANKMMEHVESCRRTVVFCVSCRYPVKYIDLTQHSCPDLEACFSDVPQGTGGEIAMDVIRWIDYVPNPRRNRTRYADPFEDAQAATLDEDDDPALLNQVEVVLRPIVDSATGDPAGASTQLESSIRDIIMQYERAEELAAHGRRTADDPPTFESTRSIADALERADQRLRAFESARSAVAEAAMRSTTPRANRYREGRGRRTVAEQPDSMLVAPRNSPTAEAEPTMATAARGTAARGASREGRGRRTANSPPETPHRLRSHVARTLSSGSFGAFASRRRSLFDN
jgi:hypothetical protein